MVARPRRRSGEAAQRASALGPYSHAEPACFKACYLVIVGQVCYLVIDLFICIDLLLASLHAAPKKYISVFIKKLKKTVNIKNNIYTYAIIYT